MQRGQWQGEVEASLIFEFEFVSSPCRFLGVLAFFGALHGDKFACDIGTTRSLNWIA